MTEKTSSWAKFLAGLGLLSGGMIGGAHLLRAKGKPWLERYKNIRDARSSISDYFKSGLPWQQSQYRDMLKADPLGAGKMQGRMELDKYYFNTLKDQLANRDFSWAAKPKLTYDKLLESSKGTPNYERLRRAYEALSPTIPGVASN